MKTIESKSDKLDKSLWPDGPWMHEPDKIQWQDEETGLPCLIVRNHMGALCGYVGVPPGHPYYGLSYHDVDTHCHGGLTFDGRCENSGHICHEVEPGDIDDIQWFGFDCSHSGDVVPKMLCVSLGFKDGVYRDIGYVRNETCRLARQFREAML